MSTAHTPGPWTFSRWTDYGDVRFYIAQAEGAPYTPSFSDVATLIAETVSVERTAIQEANARLIAAAPELLAALMELDAYVSNNLSSDYPTGVDLNAQAFLRSSAVIAKATGANP